jgi:hypothetical protein
MISMRRTISQTNEDLNCASPNIRNVMMLGVIPKLLPHFAVSYGPGLINLQ